MNSSSQDHAIASPEYREFMEEYYKFITYSTQVSQICVVPKTLKRGNSSAVSLSLKAVEMHLAAVNSYARLVAIYNQLFQKYWNDIHG
ncbi:hypothetical protein [Iningainema tapete]|uniref:Uncharacterized protein n=1 Tax=Iningainema tapete BLCC-T55 TaxID=2748662 RepID=A0A8J6XD49_9CYAN|nr:hypothetical protein [Iningainema tapete]MBD2772944.1 hypothetical protein [Iningainema tapete BLCC-T55]